MRICPSHSPKDKAATQNSVPYSALLGENDKHSFSSRSLIFSTEDPDQGSLQDTRRTLGHPSFSRGHFISDLKLAGCTGGMFMSLLHDGRGCSGLQKDDVWKVLD